MIRFIPSFVLLFSILNLFSQSLGELFQQGTEAYQRKDFQSFKRYLMKFDSLRPNYPPVVYNLATAHALLDEKPLALERLHQFILMNATHPFEEDADFASLKTEDAFNDLIQKRKSLNTEIPVDIWKKAAILDSHPEAITYTRKLNGFLIGGVRDGKIWLLKEGQAPVVWAESPTDSWAVMGLDVSPDEKLLWVCTSAIKNFEGLEEDQEGNVSILKYDLKRKILLETFKLSGHHTFGDLITDEKGNVYISDGKANHVYYLTPKNEIRLLADLSKELYNLQGICLNKSGTHLFLSDYIGGIYRLNIDSKELQKLTTSDEVLLKGIDGLYYQEGSLIGVHNGTKPNRVIRYFLDDSDTYLTNKEVISQGGLLGEPTQGAFVNRRFYYLANSPWGAYDKNGQFNPKEKQLIIGIGE